MVDRVVDKHGFDTVNQGFSGINDWENLPKPYSDADIIFQQIDTENDNYNLFKCVKAPDEGEWSDILNRVFEEIKMWQIVEETEHGPIGRLECQIVWLNGKYDDSPPNNIQIGYDDINRDRLDDFKNVDR